MQQDLAQLLPFRHLPAPILLVRPGADGLGDKVLTPRLGYMMCVMVERTAPAVDCDVKMDTAAVQEKIERIKALRQQLGWSEEVCAYHLGVTYSTLNRWERGESSPTSRVMLKAIDDFLAKYGKARTERR